MTATTLVLTLTLVLIGILIAANALEQYKQKVDHQRHQLLLQLAQVLYENDDLILNTVQLPMSSQLVAILLKRSISVMEQIIELMPESSRMPPRLEEAKQHLASLDTSQNTRPELVIPNNELQSAALIKSIKKLRHILTKQKRKGTINSREYAEEDSILSFFMLKIFVEYKINQAKIALAEQKIGSARQFFEKALKTLKEQTEHPEYVAARTQEIYERMRAIRESLQYHEDLDGDDDELLLEFEKDNGLENLELVTSQNKKKW